MTARVGIKPGYILWTPEQDQYLSDHYNTPMRIAELCVGTGGHPPDAVYKRAGQLGLARRIRGASVIGTGPTALRALTLAARPEGVSAVEMGGRPAAALSCFSVLRKRGMLFRGALGVKTVRYFTTQSAADRYVAANLAAHKAKQHRPTLSIKARPGWERDAPMVITPRTKYTYAPPPPAVVYRTNTHSPL